MISKENLEKIHKILLKKIMKWLDLVAQNFMKPCKSPHPVFNKPPQFLKATSPMYSSNSTEDTIADRYGMVDKQYKSTER